MNYRKSIHVKGEKIYFFEMTNNWYLVVKSAKVDFEIKKIKRRHVERKTGKHKIRMRTKIHKQR